MDLVSGERELCPVLFQFQWAGSHWPVLSVSVLVGVAVLPANGAYYKHQRIHSF